MSAKTFGPACIAPAITDEKLARYEVLANGASPEIKEGMTILLNCVKQWWNLPDSTGIKTPHPEEKRAFHQELDKPIADALFDHIPWGDELNMLSERFEAIQKDASFRNTRKHDEWAEQVRSAVKSERGFDKDHSALSALIRKRNVNGSLSKEDQQEAEAVAKRLNECNKTAQDAINSRSFPGMPYPAMEDTELRDAAKHLLWYVCELNLDREPMHKV